MDFGAILAPSWEPKCSQNRYKRVLENDEQKYDNQDGGTIGFWWLRLRAKPPFQSQGRRKGGGVNPSSRELEEMGLNGCWVEDFTKVLDHLSPEAGGII